MGEGGVDFGELLGEMIEGLEVMLNPQAFDRIEINSEPPLAILWSVESALGRGQVEPEEDTAQSVLGGALLFGEMLAMNDERA